MTQHIAMRRLMAVAATMSLACVMSCDWPGGAEYNNGHDVVLVPYDTISVHQLASRLEMTVDRSGPRRAVLSDSVNTVMLTAEPTPGIYVNGRAIRHGCEVLTIRGILFVSASAEDRIDMWLNEPVVQAPPRRVRLGQMRQSLPAAQPELGPVMIDPGHGGKDPGAIGINGAQDKTVALAVAKLVARQLTARNVEVLMTRSDDTFVTLDRRCEMSNNSGTKLFVSIHADAAPNAPQANGYSVFIARRPSAASVRLANAISGELASAGIVSRGVRNDNFRVLVGTTAPAVLVELGFLTNRAEAAKLVRSDYQRRPADAIVAGIMAELRTSVGPGAQATRQSP